MNNWRRWAGFKINGALPLRSMRVAFYMGDPDTGGTAAIALSWALALATQYPQDNCLVLLANPVSETLQDFSGTVTANRPPVIRLPRRYTFFPFWADAVLYRQLRQFRPDIIITTHSKRPAFVRYKQIRVTPQAGLVTRDAETRFAPLPSSHYALLSIDKKHAIKEEWTFGREFFMLTGALPSEAQLLLLLQAFSLFKNRQQSGLRLVLPFSLSKHYPALAKKIGQYKYVNALIITETITAAQRAQLAGASYALIELGSSGESIMAAAQAWRAGVPLLTLQDPGLPLRDTPSVLTASAFTKEALAAILMQIYKDESLRLQLIRSGQQCLSQIDSGTVTRALRERLLQEAGIG